jgi:hypothetical protein
MPLGVAREQPCGAFDKRQEGGTTMAEGTRIELRRTRRLTSGEWLAVGLGSGLLGGVALAVPIVIWDWVRSGHRAFELPMAATAWLFGLPHFSHTSYLAWPMVIGIALLAAYSALSGIVFTGLADRVFGIGRPLASLAAGSAWAFVSFIFFWDMLLPIARDGAPFRAAPGIANAFVAPNWTWIVAFTIFGLMTGAVYWALRTSPAHDEAKQEPRIAPSPLQRAA